MKSLHCRIEANCFFRMVGIFASLCFLLGGAAGAQEEAVKEAEEKAFVLDEIVVTATYRDTAEMDTPIAINAFDADAIADIGATNLSDIFRSIPSLNVTGSNVSAGSVSIRGLKNATQSSPAGQVLPISAIYIDDTPVTGAQGPNRQIGGDMFDIERFELLKGPQGTLYGEGSMSGTLRFIYNKPDLSRYAFKFNAMTALMEESDDVSYRLDVMANIPLIPDKLALRAVGFNGTSAGWIDRVSGDEDINDVHEKGGRIQLLLKPTDILSIRGSGHFSRQKQGGPTTIDKPYVTGTDPVSSEAAGGYHELQLYNLTAQIALPWADLISITSYLDRDGANLSETGKPVIDSVYDPYVSYLANIDAGWPYILGGNDPDYTFITGPDAGDVLDSVWLGGGGTPNLAKMGSVGRMDTERFIQELRLVSNTESRLDWVAGVFYKDSKDMINNYQLFEMFPGREWTADYYASFFESPANTHEDTLEEWSGFGEANYLLTETLEATLGLRYTDMHQEFENTNTVQDDKVWSYKGGLAWRPNEDMLIYTTVSTGFRPGNVNNGLVFNKRLYENSPETFGQYIAWIESEETYSGDEVINYDLGAKIAMLNNRINLDASAWYIDWTDMIVQQLADEDQIGPFAVGAAYNKNVGAAHSTGVELRITALVTQSLMLSAGGAWIEAELDSGDNEGNRFPHAPEWKYNASANYMFGLTKDIEADIRIDITGADDSFQLADNDLTVPSYFLTNLRVTLRDVTEGRWRCTLFAHNLFNEEVMLTDNTQTWMDPIYERYTYDRPRTIGIEFSYMW